MKIDKKVRILEMKKEIVKAKAKLVFSYTIWFGLAGLILFLATVIFKFEVFEYFLDFLDLFEFYQADELFLVVIIFIIGFLFDLILMRSQQNNIVKTQSEKLHVMKITLRTSQDIINNFLNILSFQYLQAIKNNSFNDQTASMFDKLIQETTNKLKALSYLEHIPEKTLSSGLSILDIDVALKIQNKVDEQSNNGCNDKSI